MGLEPGRRGKHDKHVAVGEDLKNLVREHIQSFPARLFTTGRVYLSPELFIARLHRMFVEVCDPEYIQLEEENLHHKIAHQPVQKLRKPLIPRQFCQWISYPVWISSK